LAAGFGQFQMNIVANLFKSSLGKKYIMAISGAGLFLFVVGHLLGNLQIFLGPEAINRYGRFLQTNKEILWLARIVLLGMVALHIWSAVKLSAENKAARPIGYADNPVPVAASYASRTMLMSGLIIAAFVLYHLLHYTVQVRSLNFTGKDFLALHDAEGRHDVFRMMVIGFSQLLVSGFYILAMGLLCLHLSHGVGAMFQSLGLKNQAYGPLIDRFAKTVAWVIFLGYISIPIAVLFGYGREALR
jgi:succinate dehydrogenase / fumarate reductase cytochrome b subunit